MSDNVTPLFGRPRQLPVNVEAEQALLGSLLCNNARTADRCQQLKPEHFAHPAHARIFERAMQLIASGRLADTVTLKADFENSGVLDEIGGIKYLVHLITMNIGWMATADYARAIYDSWLRRQLIAISEDVADAAYVRDPDNTDLDAQKIVDNAAEAILALGDHASANRGVDFATVAKRVVKMAEAAHRNIGAGRLDTGIGSVDGLWSGLWPGQLYYIMARSRTGKTPFMMQIARNVAAKLRDATKEGEPPEHVHVFSLEMTAADLMTINLASVTDYSADQIRAGLINRPERPGAEKQDPWFAFEALANRVGALPIYIDDEANMDLPGLMMRAMAIKRQKKTRLICVDFRELVRRGREQSRMQLPEWIPYLGYQLKALAKATNCPVIALAQINKPKSGELPVRPVLDDLPYDGGQAADGVFALHRPELYFPHEAPRAGVNASEVQKDKIRLAWEAERERVRGVTEFIALKRRFGPTGTPAKLRFNGPRMMLEEWNVTREPGADMPPIPPHWQDTDGVF